jgi:Putative viral replication protein/RNA helicase
MGPKLVFNPRWKAKQWAFTINNPEGGFCAGFNEETDQYMICGEEKGEQEETPHIQGYIQYKERVLGSAIKRRFPTAHIEKARGSPKQNHTYCSKGGQSHEHGEMLKGQGSRSDLEYVKELIDEGGTLQQLREESYGNYIRYRKSIIADRESVRTDRSWKTECYIYWGCSGLGKSRKCDDDYPKAYWKPYGKWWDGYDGQDVVIIDDFYGWLPYAFVLQLCDRYKLLVPYKGGFTKFTAKTIIFTSNVPWEQWWPNLNEDRTPALRRRITEVVEFKELVN